MKKYKILFFLLSLSPLLQAQQSITDAWFNLYFGTSKVNITNTPYHFRTRVNLLDHFIDRFNRERNMYSDLISDKKIQELKSSAGSLGAKDERELNFYLLQSLTNPDTYFADTAMFATFFNKMVAQKTRLQFEDGEWYAHCEAAVIFQQKEQKVQLLLSIQQQQDGSVKWVIKDVIADFLMVKKDESKGFIQPMAHENQYLDMRAAFSPGAAMQNYFEKGFEYDRRHAFTYLVNEGKIKWKGVSSTDYYFFQVEGFTFKVSYFDRKEPNSGWLISEIEALQGGCSPDEYFSTKIN